MEGLVQHLPLRASFCSGYARGEPAGKSKFLPLLYTNLNSALPVDFCSVPNFATMDDLAQIFGTHPVALHVHDRRLALFRSISMSLQPA